MAASNVMVLKSDRKLLMLAMEEVGDLRCNEVGGCVSVLTTSNKNTDITSKVTVDPSDCATCY